MCSEIYAWSWKLLCKLYASTPDNLKLKSLTRLYLQVLLPPVWVAQSMAPRNSNVVKTKIERSRVRRSLVSQAQPVV